MIRTARNVLRSGLALIILLPPFVASGAVTQAAPDSRKPEVPELKVEKYTLPNGLTVILHEDHKTPVVSVNFLYKVGSKDEKPGRTGFAHLFEHMMFQGSKNHDTDYFLPLEKLGARLNGDDRRRTRRIITRPSPATHSSWRSGSRPIAWASCCRR